MTYFDHDHRERENIRFLAMFPSLQDLWSSPSRGVAVTGSARNGVQISSDGGEAKIRDSRMTRVIHEDIWLPGVNTVVKDLSNYVPP